MNFRFQIEWIFLSNYAFINILSMFKIFKYGTIQSQLTVKAFFKNLGLLCFKIILKHVLNKNI